MRPRARAAKGQVSIPKDVQERIGLRPGDEVRLAADRRGFRLRKHFPESPFRKYRSHLNNLAAHDPNELVEQLHHRWPTAHWRQRLLRQLLPQPRLG